MALLAPDAKRLFVAAVVHRATDAAAIPGLGSSMRRRRIGLTVQLLSAMGFLCTAVVIVASAWSSVGPGRPQSPLYGIWNITAKTVNGVERALLVTERGEWRRIVFDRLQFATVQRMDDSFVNYGAVIDMQRQTLTLTIGDVAGHTLSFERPSPDRLVLKAPSKSRRRS